MPTRGTLERMLNSVPVAGLLAGLAGACVHQRAAIIPAPVVIMVAPFTARSRHNGETPPRGACWVAGELAGNALLRDGELSLSISRGWLAITRNNDKQWDDLHLVVEVTRHPPSDTSWVPLGESIPVVLRPTVDSAGPQLTTWQLHDTLRIFVPWKQAIEPRWLLFSVGYQTLSYKGERASCGGQLGTDTLRFAPL